MLSRALDQALLESLRRSLWHDGDAQLLRVLLKPRFDLLLRVRVLHIWFARAAVVLLEHLHVPVPICLTILKVLVDRVHRMDEAVLERCLLPRGTHRQREERRHHHAGSHLVLDVCHVNRLVGLRVADLVNGHQFHHALLDRFTHFPRMVVDVVPLLRHAAGARPSREGGEALRVHASGVGKNHAAPVSVHHVPEPVRHVVELVDTGVTQKAQRLANVMHVFQLLATCQVQRLRAALGQRVDFVLENTVGSADE
mmetsp:Transcript_92099/g.231602  ORF Transcript_92099/g.231602 Transcript_92099/m.231602 type:complete len:254 (+) Transcript_92099:711-1472(+)